MNRDHSKKSSENSGSSLSLESFWGHQYENAAVTAVLHVARCNACVPLRIPTWHNPFRWLLRQLRNLTFGMFMEMAGVCIALWYGLPMRGSKGARAPTVEFR